MKTIKDFVIYNVTYMISFILILGCGSKTTVQAQVKLEDATQQVKRELLNVPITQSEYSVVKGNREFSFTVKSGAEHFTPTFIDPNISVPEFRRYLSENNADNSFDSLRVYPGMKNNKVILILCLGKGGTTIEKAFMILENTNYLANRSLPAINDAERIPECHQMHENYLQFIKLHGKDQIMNPSHTMDTIRYSRYYGLSQINELIADNISQQNPNESQLSLKFETGYVDKNMAPTFQRRINAQTIDQHQGFTCLIALLDKYGNPIVDPTRPYSTNNNYEKLYLEVGSPCPPVCGDLHLN